VTGQTHPLHRPYPSAQTYLALRQYFVIRGKVAMSFSSEKGHITHQTNTGADSRPLPPWSATSFVVIHIQPYHKHLHKSPNEMEKKYDDYGASY
jgi:hypothetical protein